MQILEVGSSFMAPTGKNHQHLCIIIAPIPEKESLIVNITTSKTKINPNQDCVIYPADDLPDCITHRSTIAYEYARKVRNNEIKQMVKENKWIYKGKIPQNYIWKIQGMGILSEDLKNKYVDILKEIMSLKMEKKALSY